MWDGESSGPRTWYFVSTPASGCLGAEAAGRGCVFGEGNRPKVWEKVSIAPQVQGQWPYRTRRKTSGTCQPILISSILIIISFYNNVLRAKLPSAST